MLQQDDPEDYVIATGVQHSVREFIIWSAEELGIALHFKGTGVDEVGIVEGLTGAACPGLSVGDEIVRIDPQYYRPTEVESLLGEPSKAKKNLGWVPETTVRDMCREMIRADLNAAKKVSLLKENGYIAN